MSDILSALTAIRDAIKITDAPIAHTDIPIDPEILNLIAFKLPEPLTPRLLQIGFQKDIAQRLSAVYIEKAMQLKETSEEIIRTTCSKLAGSSRSAGGMPLQNLQRQVCEASRHRYETTVSNWAEETTELARSHLTALSSSCTTEPFDRPLQVPPKHVKRQFRSEYLPLFEFAFEKDRFPNREDKRHLAKISGMSYRQVSVWFQNRRCRNASRVKSHNRTPPPQTFQEMKERLGASAREALSKVPSTAQVFPRAYAAALSSTPVQSLQWIPSGGLKEEKTSSSPLNEGGTPKEISEVSEDNFEDEELYELADNSDMENGSAQLTIISSNPLNPPRGPIATVFPAVYKPSKPTFDPFVIEHTPWLRSSRGTRTRVLIEPTPEALENMMDEFNGMEVDFPVFDCDDSTSLTPNESTRRLEMPPSRRPTSPHTGLKSYPLSQRTFSSGSSDSWSSGASAPLSRASSYSTAPSSVISSPYHSEVPLPTTDEFTADSHWEYVSSPPTALSPSAGEESVCDTPVDDEVTRAGPFGVPSTKPVSDAPVDAWMSKVSPQQDDDAAASKWEQLLAAAVEAAPQPCA